MAEYTYSRNLVDGRYDLDLEYRNNSSDVVTLKGLVTAALTGLQKINMTGSNCTFIFGSSLNPSEEATLTNIVDSFRSYSFPSEEEVVKKEKEFLSHCYYKSPDDFIWKVCFDDTGTLDTTKI